MHTSTASRHSGYATRLMRFVVALKRLSDGIPMKHPMMVRMTAAADGMTSSVVLRVNFIQTTAPAAAYTMRSAGLIPSHSLVSSSIARAREAAERHNIGYPKLFMVGSASAAQPGPTPTVNNFAAATAANRLELPLDDILRYPVLLVSRLGGPGLRTTSRLTTLSSIDRPAGRGLTL